MKSILVYILKLVKRLEFFMFKRDSRDPLINAVKAIEKGFKFDNIVSINYNETPILNKKKLKKMFPITGENILSVTELVTRLS